MHWRTSILLLLTVLLLGATYWWFEGGPPFSRGGSGPPRGLFGRTDPDRIVRLHMEKGETRIDCRRANGHWRIVHPVSGRADAGEIARLLQGLAALTKGEGITAAERGVNHLSLATYGLDRPRGRIEWQDHRGEHVLWIGRRASVGDHVYVQVRGQDTVYAVSSLLLDLMPNSVEILRDRNLFYGDPRRVSRVEIRRASGLVQLIRRDDGTWRLQQPLSAPADGAVVRQLIDRLFRLRIEEFIADAMVDAAVYGLAETATQITIWNDGHESGQSIFLGKARTESEGQIYVRPRDGASVFAIPAVAEAAAHLRVNDLRERTLLAWDPADIEAIELAQGDQSVRLRRAEMGEWEVVEPSLVRADPLRVQALIEVWASVRIEEFLDGITDGAARGFSAASPSITFVRAGGYGAAVTLRLSESLASDGALRVMREGEPVLYTLPATVLERTIWNPLYYRHREIARIPPAAIQSIRLTINGQEQRVDRTAENGFALIRPAGEALDRQQLDRVMAAWNPLMTPEYMVDGPSDWDLYGLDKPQWIWSLSLSSEAGLGQALWIGNLREDGFRYARTRGREQVFLLDPSQSALFTTTLLVPPAVEAPEPEELDDAVAVP